MSVVKPRKTKREKELEWSIQNDLESLKRAEQKRNQLMTEARYEYKKTIQDLKRGIKSAKAQIRDIRKRRKRYYRR